MHLLVEGGDGENEKYIIVENVEIYGDSGEEAFVLMTLALRC